MHDKQGMGVTSDIKAIYLNVAALDFVSCSLSPLFISFISFGLLKLINRGVAKLLTISKMLAPLHSTVCYSAALSGCWNEYSCVGMMALRSTNL